MLRFCMRWCLFLMFIVADLTPLAAQSYDFKVYDSGVGLPQNFVYSLAQGSDGYIWMGTGEGVVRYDGLKFRIFTENDSLASSFVHKLIVDKAGVVWMGHDNGKITCYEKQQFHKIIPAETSSPIKDIAPGVNGNVWALEQNSGLIRIDANRKVHTYFGRHLYGGRKIFYSLLPVDDQTILLGTSDGLMKVTLAADTVQVVEEITGFPSVGVNVIVPKLASPGDYWVGTEGNGFYLFRMSQDKSEHVLNNEACLMYNVGSENITDIYEEEEGHLLLSTWGRGVVKLLFDPVQNRFGKSMTFSHENGMPNDYVRDILCDREGNYWYATYGGGVAALLNDHFLFFNLEQIGFKSNKVNRVIFTQNELLMGLDNGILKTDPYCFANHEFYDVFQGLPPSVITGFYVDAQETLWVATRDKGLFKRPKGSRSFASHAYGGGLLGNQINGIEGDSARIYLATMGGLFVIDKARNRVSQYTTERNLPHNNINFVRRDHNGNIWIGPKSSGICRVDVDKDLIEVHRIDDSPVDVADLTSDIMGNIWLATRGRGLIKYMANGVEDFTMANGLLKNYCHSIVTDSQNRLWVGHHPGLSCVDLKTMTVRKYGYESSLGGDFQNAWKDRDNTIWFASSQGVVRYFPDKDVSNLVAPALNFVSIEVDGEPRPLDQDIRLPYRYGDNYSFKFSFIGVSFKDPEGVTYKYKLEEVGDESNSEWIDIGNIGTREYDFLPDGEYVLKIIAYNADGVATSSPLTVSVVIKPPIWKKMWFYLLVFGVLGYLVYLLIQYRERKLIEQKKLLQREVASQTVVLRNQKAEIEKKNRDITDSINYAKRIQSSILPPLSMLKNVFPDSFVFFAPRDIVSGDFYWFYQRKEYLYISVADCTGHGVPGAFMSMIGSTLLNDIIKNPSGVSPALMLEDLDREIKVLLQKNSAEQSQDGMDISIVEINTSTRMVRLASAKRPVYLFINNEMTLYKGARRSIGESLIDADGRFVNIEYQLTKGDIIYLFSDGYSDQFGGPCGKKFMKVGVQNLLEEIRLLPMDEQQRRVKENFYNWKGDLEQVDDVIFMGVRV
ncbi:MAG: SpoIIE family protein phosphatase [Marinilabiliaceae bacterium]|nr:SpoIIE family protein phosphatase [Marinilabiliaceae bacterium]